MTKSSISFVQCLFSSLLRANFVKQQSCSVATFYCKKMTNTFKLKMRPLKCFPWRLLVESSSWYTTFNDWWAKILPLTNCHLLLGKLPSHLDRQQIRKYLFPKASPPRIFGCRKILVFQNVTLIVSVSIMFFFEIIRGTTFILFRIHSFLSTNYSRSRKSDSRFFSAEKFQLRYASFNN